MVSLPFEQQCHVTVVAFSLHFFGKIKMTFKFFYKERLLFAGVCIEWCEAHQWYFCKRMKLTCLFALNTACYAPFPRSRHITPFSLEVNWQCDPVHHVRCCANVERKFKDTYMICLGNKYLINRQNLLQPIVKL